ncbi:uncharacterized protein LOC126908569 isoform X2 [Daktulosphaira vitifoliae]|uniref:uncharacterized protein LOC126908569 isoform X2 n=1 Tax=Daktulosphaira vitifoliae TaxID=58002 RepID=UPI0021AA165B|nr:uncharacterized protein LOC126908569 isoform X2 [Daktulosphaira vitifoliae]
MDNQEEKNYIINYHLIKIYKMYHIFYPKNKPGLKIGKYNINYYAINPFLSFLDLIVFISCFIGFFFVYNDLYALFQISLSFFCAFNRIFKTIRFTRKFDELWKLFDVMRDDFLSHNCYRKDIFQHYKKKCIVVINIYATIWFISLIIWILNPLMMKEITVENRQGNFVIYRNSPLQIFFSVMSYEHYEKMYILIYLIESAVLVSAVLDILLYDITVIELCWMLSAQFKMIASKYETFGYQHTNNEENNNNSVENLRNVIINHIHIIKKIKNFYELFKPITIVQMGIMSNVYIALTFLCVLFYFKSGMLLSLIFLKFVCSSLAIMMHLYISGYFFDYLENERNSMIYAIYSCNWTNQNMELKKMLLMAFSMNNGCNIVMRLTPTKFVNIEMFAKVMNVTYSIISLLTKKKLVEQSH